MIADGPSGSCTLQSSIHLGTELDAKACTFLRKLENPKNLIEFRLVLERHDEARKKCTLENSGEIREGHGSSVRLKAVISDTNPIYHTSDIRENQK